MRQSDSPDPEDQQTRPLLAPLEAEIGHTNVFALVHRIRRDAIRNIDVALTWDQLNAPDVNFSIVRPLVIEYTRMHSKAIIHALLVVRSHFMTASEGDIAYSALCTSRAAFCQLMAIRMLRTFSNFELIVVCTTRWNPLQGASDDIRATIIAEVNGDEELEEPISALEVAIMTKSKHFLATSLVQEVINEIWSGRVLVSASSSHSLLTDDYKSRPIASYHDPKRSGLLDHYRLRVPKYRAVLEILNFLTILVLFTLCLANKNFVGIQWTEIAFCVYMFGFMLDEFAASQEHGWQVYLASLWNGFDLSFIFLFLIYFGIRLGGIFRHKAELNNLAFDVLSCGACLLVPRVAFFFISNHVVIIALRSMILKFAFFMSVAATCFSGLLFTLWKLSGSEWTLKKIAWLMTQIWFGNTYLSFTVAESFHPIFGPPLMILFAALSNTLLVTILISILSATYAKIDAHATEEYLFQSAIRTLEGVKTDALFSYQPPFNLVAYMILMPLSAVLSPRRLHTVNVFLIRLTSLHLLIVITLYERYLAPGSHFIQSGKEKAHQMYGSLPRHFRSVSVLEAMVGSSPHDLLDAVFSVQLSDDYLDDIESEPASPVAKVFDDGTSSVAPSQAQRGRYVSGPSAPTSPVVSRRSMSRNGVFLAPPIDTSSPLAKLFSGRSAVEASPLMNDEVVATIRRVEGLLEGLPEVQKLKAELKDTTDRLERIETLLLTMTRGSRS